MAAFASSNEFTAMLIGTGSPICSIVFLKRSLSSVFWMAWTEVPRTSTPNLSSTPISSSSMVMLRPVCPPIPAMIPSGLSFSMILATISGTRGSMYIMSAISGSVMMVAGLELTRTTSTPSSRKDLHA